MAKLMTCASQGELQMPIEQHIQVEKEAQQLQMAGQSEAKLHRQLKVEQTP